MPKLERITFNPAIMGGKPCIRGLRITVGTIVGLNQQLQRNHQKLPADFAFQLTASEWEALRSQFVTLKTGRGQHRKYLPYVFTEYGALQAANVLNSERASAL